MITTTVQLSSNAYAEIKRLAKADGETVHVWLRLYLDRTFGHVSLPDVPAKTPYYVAPLPLQPLLPARDNNLPGQPFEIGDVPGQPDITCRIGDNPIVG